ncbi:hypothetical protein DSOUD_0763 [Desulfuromonas soudanensis]|uniref:Flavin reductase like domain-containing protein n=2 Tax=Desulfuromonas soudanensis TaxID=1603606 RepID=A0A0M4DFM3_9BACT|nr:hypothetical protein DSOUD_0763 [Desulfuromonas soudanensis]
MVECLRKLDRERLHTGGAWMTYTTPDGDWGVSPVGWLGIVCSLPPLISFRLQSRQYGEGELCPGSSFEIHLAPFSDPADPNASEKGGLGVERGAKFPPAACPVRIECRNASFDGDDRLGMVSGEVLTIHIGGVSYGLAEENPFEPIRSFARTWKRHLQPADSSAGEGLDMAGLGCK